MSMFCCGVSMIGEPMRKHLAGFWQRTRHTSI